MNFTKKSTVAAARITATALFVGALTLTAQFAFDATAFAATPQVSAAAAPSDSGGVISSPDSNGWQH